MSGFVLSDCQEPLDGQLFGDDPRLTGFSIDTRTLQAEDLYIAISGERFDGHDFCQQAVDKGACALLLDRQVDIDIPQLVVSDTRIALGQLAKLWARSFQLPTVAITGSNGKTTVKEMIASILSQLGPVLSTKGNLNNEIGVPLTLLRMRPHHQYAVIEMGASAPGEILKLSKLVEADVALVNNVGTAHLEGFGSEADVANAKSEIFAGLSEDGWAVINTNDKYADVMRAAASHCHAQEFGTGCDVCVELLDSEELSMRCGNKTLSPRFSLLGQHNRMNAAAATAVAQCLDVQAVAVMAGLANVRAVPGRLQRRPAIHGATIIDDSYNANPNSAKAAIDVLAALSGRRILVLGDMAELGDEAAELHAAIGTYAKEAGIDQMLTVGELSAAAANSFGSGEHFDSQQALVEKLGQLLDRNTVLLVKGSRGSKMEKIVGPLLEQSTPEEAQLEVDASEISEAICL